MAAHNNEKAIENGVQKIRDIYFKRIITALQETMWDLVSGIDVPIDTHNLWDSIGCGVYYNGSLISVEFPNKTATEPRKFKFKAGDPNIYYSGSYELEEMIIKPPIEILSYSGFCLYYVAAQPYSQIVEDVNGADVLREDFVIPLFIKHLGV